MRTKSRIRFRKRERVHRQAGERISEVMTSDQRRVLTLSQAGYDSGEIARELALPPDYVNHFMTGLVQRLSHNGVIPSPDWRNVIHWAILKGLIEEQTYPISPQ